MEPMQPPEPMLPQPPRSSPIQPGGFPGWGAAPGPQPGLPGWGGPQLPYGVPVPPVARTPGLAIAALICGLLGLITFWIFGIIPLLGLIFGLVSAKSIKNSGGTLTGLGKARAGWITGLIGVLSASAFLWAGLTGRLDTDEDASSNADREPAVGDCLRTLPDEGVVFELDYTTCLVPHDGEIFEIGTLNADRGREYPGEVAVQTEVQQACFDAFEAYVGRPYDISVFEIQYLYPQALTWNGERGLYVCFAVDIGSTFAGSAFHSDR